MAAILKTFAGLNFYTRTCFIDYYHISFKKSHQTLRPRSCRVNQNFDISWILYIGDDQEIISHLLNEKSYTMYECFSSIQIDFKKFLTLIDRLRL